MERKRKVLFAKMAVVASVVPVLIYAYEYGPDPGNTGAPGQSTCAQAGCHSGTAVNAGGGSVAVTFPADLSYTPGTRQHLVVTVTDSAARRAGFQLTALLAGDSTKPAGTFSPSDNTTQVLCSTPPFTAQQPAPCPANLPMQFIEHTIQAYQQGKTSFEFDWTPPATDVGPVTIYVAGNGANGDLTNRGDHIYTQSYTLTPAAAGGSAPSITGVVNGASFQPGIAAGSWVTVQGANLASGTRTWRADEIVNGNLPTKLDDVSVTINGKPAAVYFISPTQLNVQAPSDTATGPVPVVVTTAAGASAPFTAQLQSFSPAFFLWTGKYAVATRPDFSWVGKPDLFPGVATTPAKPGDVIILWGTGFGPTNPAVPGGVTVTGAPTLTTVPTVRIGGAAAEYLGGALSPGSAGLYQIAVRVPAGTPAGDIPVVVDAGGVSSPDGVFLTVQPQ